jgi:menaquinone-9 beta-reductase
MQSQDLFESNFDCIVIGAGVAGGLAGYLLAKEGRKVLIVDAKKFPRDKVCGSCLNHRGQMILQRSGLLNSIKSIGGAKLDEMRLIFNQREFCWLVPGMLSSSRASFDNTIVDAAKEVGATFIDNCKAIVLPIDRDDNQEHRSVELSLEHNSKIVARASLVLVADGLTHSSLARLPEFASKVQPNARIGLHTMINANQVSCNLRSNLTMVVCKDGYTGIAPVEADRIDIAAAVDPSTLVDGKRPWHAIAKMLDNTSISIDESTLREAKWLATPPLSRTSSRAGSHRLLLLGDALGYVEPFTGEGMSWALQSAELVQQIALDAIKNWNDDFVRRWTMMLKSELNGKRWICRQLTSLLRYPRSAVVVATVFDQLPMVRNWAIQKVSAA